MIVRNVLEDQKEKPAGFTLIELFGGHRHHRHIGGPCCWPALARAKARPHAQKQRPM